MLFNSFTFIFGFLPLALLSFYGAGRVSRSAASIVLTALSLGFYAWWRPQDLIVLCASISFNFFVGTQITRARDRDLFKSVKFWLILGVVVDLFLLGYFKYANFIVDSVATVTGADWHLDRIVLPLAISFFTFQKIAYLIDAARGEVKGTGFVEFGLFASFFPQLLAGPIVHYSEIIPQFRGKFFAIAQNRNLIIGLVIFGIGLFKKTVLADTFASYADPLFVDVASRPHDLVWGWTAAVLYTLQLYFDFSGYSDMAIGLARMFGILLPLNFHSPLRASSIIDYWRRWHITLQRFIVAYLFQPLALPCNRWAIGKGFTGWPAFFVGAALPSALSFFIMGIWHGAGWTFVVFGLMQAAYVTTNEAWRERRKLIRRKRRKLQLPEHKIGRLEMAAYHALTLFCVAAGNVMFRAGTVEDAWVIIKGMAGLGGLNALHFNGLDIGMLTIAAIGVTLIAFFPNTQQIMSNFRPAINYNEWRNANIPLIRWQWRPNMAGAMFASFVLFLGVLFIQRGQAVFLYFNF